MIPESRTPLHVTVFVCIITLLIMTACGIGKTGSGNGGTRYPDESFRAKPDTKTSLST